jgi:ABC-type sugar transport system substrate-binding protein
MLIGTFREYHKSLNFKIIGGMRKMLKKSSLILLMWMIMALVACSNSKSSSGEEKSGDKPLIAYSQGDNGNSWRVTNTNDMEDAAKKEGYDFIWADAKADPSKQLSDIQDLLAKKPDVLVISPVQEKAVASASKLAKRAGIPLITIDREIDAKLGDGTYVAKIVQDWKEAGRIQGEYIVEKLKEKYGSPKGNVVEIAGTVGASPAVDNAKGIREVLDKYPEINIIDSQSGDYAREPGRKVMEDFLQKYPKGKIDIVVTHNDEMTIGALQAIKSANRTELLGYIASKDGFVDAIKEIIDGNIFVSVQASPYYGKATMELVKKVLNGEKIDPADQYIDFKTFDNSKNKEETEKYYKYQIDNKLQY